MSHTQRLIGGVVVVILTALMIAVTQVPYAAERADHSLVRLSWRANGLRVEQCRPLSDEERANIPIHMQQEQICEGQSVPFLLRVEIDGNLISQDTLRGAGTRHDRPIYVFNEIRVAPGTHDLSVSFAPGPAADSAGVAMAFDQSVDLALGDIVLIGRDPGTGQLRLYRSEH